MAAYISVPRDLTKVKSKVAFNLTKRQLLCFGTGGTVDSAHLERPGIFEGESSRCNGIFH